MNVLMLADFPVDASEISGGVQSAAYNLVTALVEHTDVSVTVVSFSYDATVIESRTPYGARIRVIRVPFEHHLNTLTRYQQQRRVLGRILRENCPDILHAQSEGFYATLAVHSGVPNVYTVHGVGLKEIELQRLAVGRLRSDLRARMIRAHHRRARNIIVINDYTRNEISRLHKARIWQIPNAVDESFFELSMAEGTPARILLVGGVSERKDTETALKAVRRVLSEAPELRLDIVGPIAANYRETIDPLLDAWQLSGNVFIHGPVTRQTLQSLYCSADVFLLTSREESSPISIVEAMAVGKPIVATGVGGVAEIVAHGVNGYICPVADDVAIADALRILVTDRVLRDRFARASRERASARWSARAVALATYDAYEEILRGS
jgi:glycosyltransferase involved in cell wall biosynthesis